MGCSRVWATHLQQGLVQQGLYVGDTRLPRGQSGHDLCGQGRVARGAI